MTSVIINYWLLKWDNQLNHKILLLIDNCKAHILNVSLKHINVVFLPANATSLILPCDQGIIRALKVYYQHEMQVRILGSFEDNEEIDANELAKKTTLLETVHLLTNSGNRILADTIRNCFTHRGFCEALDEKLQIVIEPPEGMQKEEYEEWLSIDEDIPVVAILTGFEICQAVCEQDQTLKVDDSNEDKCVEGNPPTKAEMRQALDILKCCVQHRSNKF
ncbi:hypothetical protein AVEN_128658-1 [Araneus ventricosus]|uniref:DDE-1 domain-containing protein n=1 Tax=Araneus ventricosus TaxID=182803 RepID=A0A4Y2L3Q7_ARAVE|nr:hypothetical protein AVEN_128658-1 [Araneus ventricosus]